MSAAKAHPSLGDPGDLVEYYPQAPLPGPVAALAEPIKVRVPSADIPTIFAHRQWRAGMLLADLVYTNALPLEDRNVLELGAGTGLPSIAACRWGKARHVVVTDYDSPSLIATLRANVQVNTPHRSPITVLGHTWATAIDDMHDTVPDGRFDVILLADCIWDSLSHAALLKSITSLLRRDGKARVYMVSGLHTGRAKIVSFLHRARRLGLLLTDFPPPSPGQQWPLLTQAEGEVQAQETAAYAHDDALALAPTQVLEMQVLTDKSEEAVVHTDTRIWQAKTTRLNGMRRAFVVEEKEEEKKENNGVHVRNTWITFAALAWQT